MFCEDSSLLLSLLLVSLSSSCVYIHIYYICIYEIHIEIHPSYIITYHLLNCLLDPVVLLYIRLIFMKDACFYLV